MWVYTETGAQLARKGGRENAKAGSQAYIGMRRLGTRIGDNDIAHEWEKADFVEWKDEHE